MIPALTGQIIPIFKVKVHVLMITDIIRPYILWFKTLLKIHYIQKDHYLYVIMALTTIKINLKMYTIFPSS